MPMMPDQGQGGAAPGKPPGTFQIIHSLRVVRKLQYYGYRADPDLQIECRYFNPTHGPRIRTILMKGWLGGEPRVWKFHHLSESE